MNKNTPSFNYSLYATEQLLDLYATMASRHQYVEMIIFTSGKLNYQQNGEPEKAPVTKIKNILNVFKRKIAKGVKPIKTITNLRFYQAIALKDHGGEKHVDIVFFFIGYNDYEHISKTFHTFSLFYPIARESFYIDKTQAQKVTPTYFQYYSRRHPTVKEKKIITGEDVMRWYIQKWAQLESRPVADENTRRGDRQYYLFSHRTHQFSIYEKEILLRHFFTGLEIGDNLNRTFKRTNRPRTVIASTLENMFITVSTSRLLIE